MEQKTNMASGDCDHIEVMELSVTKKADMATGPSGSEDEGRFFNNTNIFLMRISVLKNHFVYHAVISCISYVSDRDRVSIAEKNVPYDVSSLFSCVTRIFIHTL